MNTILLQSSNTFDEMVEFDPLTNIYIRWSKRENPQRLSRPIHGHIGQLDHHILILYRSLDGKLHLVADNLNFEDAEGLFVEYTKGPRNRLVIYQGGKEIMTIDYKPIDLYPPLEEDITPFVEEEDFDFGLFVYNVLNDNNRRERIYRI